MSTQSVAQALRSAVQRLKAADVPSASGDARVLLAHAMGIPAGRLTMHMPDPLEPQAEAVYDEALKRRCARQPVSHILGWREFYGRRFRVGPEVLDPRPETETLIATALEKPAHRILDLGTGSGCILLTLLAELPKATGLGVDLSDAALPLAKENAQALDLGARARFALGNWGQGVSETFDLVVSNPPYIAADEMPDLSPEVVQWEPHMALSPGADGVLAYRQIIAGLPMMLEPGGRVLFEIGPTQAAAVSKLLEETLFSQIRVTQDLDGRDRVVSAVYP